MFRYPKWIFEILLRWLFTVFHDEIQKSSHVYRLKMVYPALFQDEDTPPITPGTQAINQLIASIVTLVVALVGGALTGEDNQSTKGVIITNQMFQKAILYVG